MYIIPTESEDERPDVHFKFATRRRMRNEHEIAMMLVRSCCKFSFSFLSIDPPSATAFMLCDCANERSKFSLKNIG